MKKLFLCIVLLVLSFTRVLAQNEVIVVSDDFTGKEYTQDDQITVTVTLSNITTQRYLSIDFSNDGGVTFNHADNFFGKVTDGVYHCTFQFRNSGKAGVQITRADTGYVNQADLAPTTHMMVRASLWDFDLSWLGNNLMSRGLSKEFSIAPISLTLTSPTEGSAYKLTDQIALTFSSLHFRGNCDVYLSPDLGVTWKKVNSGFSWIPNYDKGSTITFKVGANSDGTFKLLRPADDFVYLSNLAVGSGYLFRVNLKDTELYVQSGAITISDNKPYPYSNSRFINLSTLISVSPGGQLTSGFVIAGSNSQQVLIRGVGPGLGALGVSGVMEDPVLEVYDAASKLVASNQDWETGSSTPSSLKAAFQSAGAFSLPDGSKDAALLLTLNPGLYTVTVKDSNGHGGYVIAEVYQVN